MTARNGDAALRARAARVVPRGLGLLLLVASGCSDGTGDGSCQPADADGVVGGKYTFQVTVDDQGFTPAILKAQNTASVTVVLHNAGSSPHGFAVACITVPNDTGCPTRSCFPDPARIDPVAPGDSATAKFVVPLVEGIYPITSTADGDTQKAQFVVQ